jgi:hypothetical protein
VLVADDSGWAVADDLPEDDDPRNGLHARARRIRTAGSADSSLDYALKVLFDPLADPAERRAVLMRQDLPRDVIIRATEVSEPGVRAFAVGLDRTPMEIVVSAAEDEAWQVRVEAARRRGCPPELLERLARDRDSIVRRGALANPGIPARVLVDVLLHGRSRLDAEVAAGNGGFGLGPHVEALLDVNAFGAHALLMRGSLPVSLVARFAEPDHVESVRLAAVRTGSCPAGVLARLVTGDVSAQVRAAAAGQSGCPADALAAAAVDTSEKVRRCVAEHEQCPPDAVDRLLEDEDESVRLRAAMHPLASPAGLGRRALLDDNRKVRIAALRNEACPAAAVDEACGDSAVVIVAARHPSCTAEGQFRALLTLRDAPRPRRARPAGETDVAAQRAKALQSVVWLARKRLGRAPWEWLANHPLPELHPDDLRALLTRHLASAARDSRPQVRMAVARHPNVDDATLVMLASDADDRVRVEVSTRVLDIALGTTRR